MPKFYLDSQILEDESGFFLACVLLDNLCNLSEPQFPLLYNGYNHSIYHIGLELNENMSIKRLACCLSQRAQFMLPKLFELVSNRTRLKTGCPNSLPSAFSIWSHGMPLGTGGGSKPMGLL